MVTNRLHGQQTYRRQWLHRKLCASDRRGNGCIANYSLLLAMALSCPTCPPPTKNTQFRTNFCWMRGESTSSQNGMHRRQGHHHPVARSEGAGRRGEGVAWPVLPQGCVPGSGRPSNHKLTAAGPRAAKLQARGERWCLMPDCYVFKASIAHVFAPGIASHRSLKRGLHRRRGPS